MNEVGEGENQETLVGVHVVAAFLAALGLLMAIYTLLFLWVVCLSVLRHGRPPNPYSEISHFGYAALLTAALTYLTFKAAFALRSARRWAAYIAMAWAFVLLSLSAMWIFDLYHPHREAPDEYFGTVVFPPLIAVGLWWCVYLNLPRVRKYLRPRKGIH